MAHRISHLLSLGALFLPAQFTWPVEALSARELVAHCDAFPDAIDSADGQFCIRYIQGFIDGAVATDVRVMLNLEADNARSETYTERAIRTRGANRESRSRASAYAEFCLGDPVPLREVVAEVVTDLYQRKYLAPELTARDVVYTSLRTHYPCKKQGPKT